MDVTTLDATASQLPANDTVLEAPRLTNREQRRRRILELREAIEAGEYRVSSSELADAIFRAANRAN